MAWAWPATGAQARKRKSAVPRCSTGPASAPTTTTSTSKVNCRPSALTTGRSLPRDASEPPAADALRCSVMATSLTLPPLLLIATDWSAKLVLDKITVALLSGASSDTMATPFASVVLVSRGPRT